MTPRRRIHCYPGGYYVPPGWAPMVLPMLDQLESMRADIYACVEKYGGLKVHLIDPKPEEQAVYIPVMRACNWLCEDCGKPGVLRCSRYGHMKTCCKDHPPETTHRVRSRKNHWEM